jgi:hypothetical protein
MYPKLTARDIQAILSVYQCRYLTGTQLERLHFPSPQVMWRRMKALLDMGFVKSFTAPHIPERIFYLDKKGAEIAAIESRLTMEELDWRSHQRVPKDYYFLRHFLAINDFRITLLLACQKSDLSLIGFIPEFVGEKNDAGHVKKYLRDRITDKTFPTVSYSHTPDAVFCLEKDQKPALFFLEIDRGGEILSDAEKGFLKCVVFYLNYWPGTEWKRYEKDFNREFRTFRMLTVTTSQERLQHMRETVTRYPFVKDQAKRYLWGTIQTNISTDWILGRIWQAMDMQDTNLYSIG